MDQDQPLPISNQEPAVPCDAELLQEMLRVTLDSTEDCVSIVDPQVRLIVANEAFARTFQHLHGVVLTPGVDVGAVYRTHRPQVFEGILTALKGEPVSIRKERQDDQHLVEASFLPVRSLAGDTLGVLIRSSDITLRIQAEQSAAQMTERLERQVRERTIELVRSEALANAVVENMADGVVVVRPTGEIVVMNRAFTLMHDIASHGTSYRNSDILQREFRLYGPDGEELPHAQRPLTRTMRGESVRGLIATIETVNTGHRFVASVSTTAVMVEGKLAYAVMTSHDITALIKTQQALRDSEALYRQIAEGLPEIVWGTRADGYHEYFNSKWFEFTGLTYEESRGDGWIQVVHPDDIEPTTRRWSRSLQSETPYETEYRFRAHSGEYRWFLGRALPLRDEQGSVVRWFGTCTDIHDQKMAEELLERRVEERTADLLAAVRELEGFTYSVSHDLRAPLRAIVATSSMLIEDASEHLSESDRSLLERQASNARRLGVLIDDLLQMSRIARSQMRWQEVDLSSLADEVLTELRDRPWPQNVTVEIEPCLSGIGDARLLRFVLQNLLENAYKFSPDGGTIRFGREGQAFFVSDEGIGFDMQYASKLFLPFERLVLERDYPGTGIGLANVQRIIQRHHGSVWAQSELGHGATFYFTLGDSTTSETSPSIP